MIFYQETQSLVNQLLVIIFMACFILQLIYWGGVYTRLPAWKPRRSGIRLFPVSVIICARDEASNLSRNLPLILEQDYP